MVLNGVRLRRWDEPVAVGDTLIFAGSAHIVASLDRRNGFDHPVADCADGWSVALRPNGSYGVRNPDERWCALATGGGA